MMNIMNVNPEIISAYLFYATVVTLKTMAMTFATAYQRITKKIFSNPEDAAMNNGKIDLNNESVERVRRAHLNDMETIFPFLFLGAAYCTTGPSTFVAINLFRIFTLARIVHSIVYLFQMPQPSRFLAFLVSILCNIFMAMVIFFHYL
ncbi:hypothetical protein TCAL_05769 [Tigriopus californicus]|uniref:Microsomal glutathione S-transferase 1 n=1 Tax=Tigriopus californicus TaxID=6832 RepID=A0A553NCA5_TIGCA|nr:microsomal glutathione S-transferase 1-like [Tigriopus californicus]TRY63073.1 hypothetical protein TCAL_05769 [Tigriopus californicus]